MSCGEEVANELLGLIDSKTARSHATTRSTSTNICTKKYLIGIARYHLLNIVPRTQTPDKINILFSIVWYLISENLFDYHLPTEGAHGTKN